MIMAESVCLLITGIVRAATRLWKQPCDHRPEAPDWCSLFDGGSAFSGRPAERPPFKGLWRPKVSMVVTTVSHCFWTILDGARFYDAGDDSSPRGCTWRAGSSRGQTSRRQVCWPGCSRRGKGSLLPPSQGGCPCLYLLQPVSPWRFHMREHLDSIVIDLHSVAAESSNGRPNIV